VGHAAGVDWRYAQFWRGEASAWLPAGGAESIENINRKGFTAAAAALAAAGAASLLALVGVVCGMSIESL